MNTNTSEKKINEKALKTGFIYLIFATFVALAGFIYEQFSHNVFSYFMLYAFAFPLFGAILYLSLAMSKTKFYPCIVTGQLLVATVSTFCVGSIILGVLEIYGTTSFLSDIYWYVGAALVVAFCVSFVVDIIKNK